MPTQIWIVEGNNESERGSREMYMVEWEKVTQIARAHGGHYCSGIGSRYAAWRTFSGFAFRSEEGARAFEEEIALARTYQDNPRRRSGMTINYTLRSHTGEHTTYTIFVHPSRVNYTITRLKLHKAACVEIQLWLEGHFVYRWAREPLSFRY